MKLVTRSAWGARPPSGDWAYIASTLGVKIHYEGTWIDPALAADHTRCAAEMRSIQASHMANKAEGYIDIAYNAMVCPHGYVFEGRGPHHKTGANGNATLNAGHYAVCAMLGDTGLTEPTPAMLDGLRDAVEWFRLAGGAGPEIKGHRDGYATSCPGGPLYAWVQAGAPRPDSTDGDDMPDDATLRRMIREETTAAMQSVDGRDAVAYAVRNYNGDGSSSLLARTADKADIAHEVLYWLNQALSEHPEVAGAPLTDVVSSLSAKFAEQRVELTAVKAALAAVLDAVDGIDTAAVTVALSGAVRDAVGHLDIHVTGGTTS